MAADNSTPNIGKGKAAMNDNLKSLVGTIAPTLATMLGGPLAGTAVSALAGAFGLSVSSASSDIISAVQAGSMTPEVVASMRAADQKHAEAMAQQGIDLEKLNLAHQELMAATDAGDRDSARRREATVKDWTPVALASGTTLGFFGMLVMMMFVDPPAGSKEVVMAMVGSLGSAWVSVVSYYFGSSSGHARQTELLAQAPAIVSESHPKRNP